MYALGSEKDHVFKSDLEGDVFVKYDSSKDEIIYLANLRNHNI